MITKIYRKDPGEDKKLIGQFPYDMGPRPMDIFMDSGEKCIVISAKYDWTDEGEKCTVIVQNLEKYIEANIAEKREI